MVRSLRFDPEVQENKISSVSNCTSSEPKFCLRPIFVWLISLFAWLPYSVKCKQKCYNVYVPSQLLITKLFVRNSMNMVASLQFAYKSKICLQI